MLQRAARSLGAAVLLVLTALLLAAPTPAGALSELTRAPADQPLAPVAPAAALLAWALAGWLAVVLVAVAAGRLPGRAGRHATALAGWVAPAALRRIAQLALGLTLATGAVAVPSAGAETTQPARVVAALDWPLVPDGPTAPALDWPAPAPAPPAAPAPDAVVVHPGDTLWDLAAAHLPPGAAPAAIARAWPAWWSANRAAIGDDPDLIRPGTRLVPPAPTRH